MTIASKAEMQERPIEIDLTGPEGNAFVLIGYAKQWFKQLGNETMMLLHGVTWEEVQKGIMGWNVPMAFEESLRRTVEWTLANPKWLDLEAD